MERPFVPVEKRGKGQVDDGDESNHASSDNSHTDNAERTTGSGKLVFVAYKSWFLSCLTL